MANFQAVMRTAEGDTKVFAGFVGQFITSHPRASVALALIAGIMAGHTF